MTGARALQEALVDAKKEWAEGPREVQSLFIAGLNPACAKA